MKAYIEPEEIALMEKAATCFRDRLLIRLLFRLGCRVSEALALTVEDIDFVHGTITVEHLKARLKLSCAECGQALGRSHTFCPKCGGKVEKAQSEQQERRRQRVLPADDDILSMLNDYIHRGGPVVREGKRLVFGINRHRAWQIVRDCAEKAGLPDLVNPETGKRHGVSPHRLRDAFAVHAVKIDDSGDGLRLLQEHLGHASFNTTAKYRKVAGEELREWYQRLWDKSNEDFGQRRTAVFEPLRPARGGFLRPFGCGWFIREFLSGHGPNSSPRINPDVGAPQADIFYHYKTALLKATALDRATRREERQAQREKRAISPEEIERLTERYLAGTPYKSTSCRYHSFVVYFSNLQRLSWVEFTGREEVSAFQDHYPAGPPRRYFRLTKTGREASDAAWSNPYLALYEVS